jgi:hypothetical protein
MFLLPSELEFVEQLKAANLEVEEFDFPKKKLSSIQDQIEKLVAKNYELNVLAKDGFRLVSPAFLCIGRVRIAGLRCCMNVAAILNLSRYLKLPASSLGEF